MCVYVYVYVCMYERVWRIMCEDVDQNLKGKTDSKQRQVCVRACVCMHVCMYERVWRIMCEDADQNLKGETDSKQRY